MTLTDILNFYPVTKNNLGPGLGVVFKPHSPRIHCYDGTTLSVQVGENLYCTPRFNNGPWSKVEVGFPSRAFPELAEYQDGDSETQENSVFGYVPIEIVESIIEQCGGICAEWTIFHARPPY